MDEHDEKPEEDRAMTLRSKGEEKLQEGKEAARSALAQGQQKANDILDSGKSTLADQVQSVAEATRSAAQTLRDRDQGNVADWVDTAADSAETAAANLRDSDVGQIYGQITDFARRQPTIFIAGAAILGFAAARFASATAEVPPATTDHSRNGDLSVSQTGTV